MYPQSFHNQRRFPRYENRLPIQISFGSQITLQGQLKDISLKSAFVNLKCGSVYMQQNDEVRFTIQRSPESILEGSARISRIAEGEGIAIYFTNTEDTFQNQLKELIKE